MIHMCATLYQKLHNFCVSLPCGRLEGRSLLIVTGVHISMIVNQQPDHFNMPLPAGHMEGRSSLSVTSFHICSIFKKILSHGQLIFKCQYVECWASVCVFVINITTVAQQQFNNVPVAVQSSHPERIPPIISPLRYSTIIINLCTTSTLLNKGIADLAVALKRSHPSVQQSSDHFHVTLSRCDAQHSPPLTVDAIHSSPPEDSEKGSATIVVGVIHISTTFQK
ncbi:hypothetical protein F7725_010560 [Dissostichus mawsoni]|uniref:Uncharacterized protein n=1 Tax=Dissostichus mawsoni TaxID=36200 RepID=A0A7J5XNV5_DISMA|nr:hypothetical protein F7725_010560 [Dissostichus mawsoni]